MAFDLTLFTTAIISAIMSYSTACLFIYLYAKEKKSNRLIYGLAFILYAIGHTIQACIVPLNLDLTSYTFFMWLYVNLAGAGTTGLVLYSTIPFITEKKGVKEAVTAIFMGAYVIGSMLLAFVLPGDTPLKAVVLVEVLPDQPEKYYQLINMSWWVVELLIPMSFFIGFVFFKHFKTSGKIWGLLIGASFVIYAIILFIWPIAALKPIFYVIRTISVALLCVGGILLAKE